MLSIWIIIRLFNPAKFRFVGLEALMKSFVRKVKNFLVSEDGPTAVEYAVMLALIIVVCLVAIGTIGTKANATFSNVAGQLGAAS